MMELLMVRQGKGLLPAAPYDAERFQFIPDNAYVTVTIDEARLAVPMSRLYWATLNDIAKGTGSTKDLIHQDLMRRAGKYEAVFADAEGTVIKTTIRSTSGWDTPEWREYLDHVFPIILQDYIPGVPAGPYRAKIEKALQL